MCRFCDINNGKYTYEHIDEPFYSNKDFFSIVSIGALVEGWTLVIPKKHVLSMRSFYLDDHFIRIVNDIAPKLQEKYGKIIAFEHGSYTEKSLTSCGTDHAHLHLVPFQSLLPAMTRSNLVFEKCRASDIAEKAGESEYLFYNEIYGYWDDSIGYLHILEKPVSQYFRKMISQLINRLEEFDYRVFPKINNCIATRNIMHSEFVSCHTSVEKLNVSW